MSRNRKPNKSFDHDGKSENEKIRSLQKTIKDRDKEIARLKAELKTLNAAFAKSAEFMSSQSKTLKVEELISAANKHQTLEQAKKEFVPDVKEERERERESVRQKWAEWARVNRATPSDPDGEES